MNADETAVVDESQVTDALGSKSIGDSSIINNTDDGVDSAHNNCDTNKDKINVKIDNKIDKSNVIIFSEQHPDSGNILVDNVAKKRGSNLNTDAVTFVSTIGDDTNNNNNNVFSIENANNNMKIKALLSTWFPIIHAMLCLSSALQFLLLVIFKGVGFISLTLYVDVSRTREPSEFELRDLAENLTYDSYLEIRQTFFEVKPLISISLIGLLAIYLVLQTCFHCLMCTVCKKRVQTDLKGRWNPIHWLFMIVSLCLTNSIQLVIVSQPIVSDILFSTGYVLIVCAICGHIETSNAWKYQTYEAYETYETYETSDMYEVYSHRIHDGSYKNRNRSNRDNRDSSKDYSHSKTYTQSSSRDYGKSRSRSKSRSHSDTDDSEYERDPDPESKQEQIRKSRRSRRAKERVKEKSVQSVQRTPARNKYMQGHIQKKKFSARQRHRSDQVSYTALTTLSDGDGTGTENDDEQTFNETVIEIKQPTRNHGNSEKHSDGRSVEQIVIVANKHEAQHRGQEDKNQNLFQQKVRSKSKHNSKPRTLKSTKSPRCCEGFTCIYIFLASVCLLFFLCAHIILIICNYQRKITAQWLLAQQISGVLFFIVIGALFLFQYLHPTVIVYIKSNLAMTVVGALWSLMITCFIIKDGWIGYP